MFFGTLSRFRPVDVRPVDVRPVDVRPVGVRPADVRPVDGRPVRCLGSLPLCVVLLVQADRKDTSDRCLGSAAE